jgi:lipopolysaccharide export system protein LptC
MSIFSPTPEELPKAAASPGGTPGVDQARVTLALARWRRRSRLIHFLRRALPAGMGLLVLTLVGWVLVKSWLILPFNPGTLGVIRVVNPHYVGRDDHGRSYAIDAREAQQNIGGGEIELTEPRLQLISSQSRSLTVQAHLGAYDNLAQQVVLKGDVRISSGDGTEFRTELARIDVRTGNASANSPIQGVGPLGQITASSYAIFDRGARAQFIGQVHARLQPRHK